MQQRTLKGQFKTRSKELRLFQVLIPGTGIFYVNAFQNGDMLYKLFEGMCMRFSFEKMRWVPVRDRRVAEARLDWDEVEEQATVKEIDLSRLPIPGGSKFFRIECKEYFTRVELLTGQPQSVRGFIVRADNPDQALVNGWYGLKQGFDTAGKGKWREERLDPAPYFLMPLEDFKLFSTLEELEHPFLTHM